MDDLVERDGGNSSLSFLQSDAVLSFPYCSWHSFTHMVVRECPCNMTFPSWNSTAFQWSGEYCMKMWKKNWTARLTKDEAINRSSLPLKLSLTTAILSLLPKLGWGTLKEFHPCVNEWNFIQQNKQLIIVVTAVVGTGLLTSKLKDGATRSQSLVWIRLKFTVAEMWLSSVMK